MDWLIDWLIQIFEGDSLIDSLHFWDAKIKVFFASKQRFILNKETLKNASSSVKRLLNLDENTEQIIRLLQSKRNAIYYYLRFFSFEAKYLWLIQVF